MEFLTYVGKIKGVNHFFATITGREGRAQYSGWRFMPLAQVSVPVAQPLAQRLLSLVD
jgi:hypothetical protein